MPHRHHQAERRPHRHHQVVLHPPLWRPAGPQAAAYQLQLPGLAGPVGAAAGRLRKPLLQQPRMAVGWLLLPLLKLRHPVPQQLLNDAASWLPPAVPARPAASRLPALQLTPAPAARRLLLPGLQQQTLPAMPAERTAGRLPLPGLARPSGAAAGRLQVPGLAGPAGAAVGRLQLLLALLQVPQ